MNPEHIAQVCHEANRAYCLTIGDQSQPLWTDAPDWQRDSAISGVRHHLDNPGLSPSASHDEWLRHKKEQGWQWGPVKDVAKMEHPCFVPYDQLPIEQRRKDALFAAIVRAFREPL